MGGCGAGCSTTTTGGGRAGAIAGAETAGATGTDTATSYDGGASMGRPLAMGLPNSLVGVGEGAVGALKSTCG